MSLKDLQVVLTQLLIINIMIYFGYHLRKRKYLSEDSSRDLSRIISNYIFPVFLFLGFNKDINPAYTNVMICISALIFCYLLTAYGMGVLFSKRLILSPTDKNTFIYNTIFGNVAFLAIPIFENIYPDEGVFFCAFFTFVQNLFQWTLGMNLIKPHSPGQTCFTRLKAVFTPSLIAVVLGIIKYFSGIPVPKEVQDLLTPVKNCCIPLALIVAGSSLYGYNVRDIVKDKTVQLASLLKTVFLPAIFIIIVLFLPLELFLGEKYALMVKVIITVQAAGPAQSSSTAFMKAYGGNAEQSAKVTLLTTIYCIVTIPVFLVITNLFGN